MCSRGSDSTMFNTANVVRLSWFALQLPEVHIHRHQVIEHPSWWIVYSTTRIAREMFQCIEGFFTDCGVWTYILHLLHNDMPEILVGCRCHVASGLERQSEGSNLACPARVTIHSGVRLFWFSSFDTNMTICIGTCLGHSKTS